MAALLWAVWFRPQRSRLHSSFTRPNLAVSPQTCTSLINRDFLPDLQNGYRKSEPTFLLMHLTLRKSRHRFHSAVPLSASVSEYVLRAASWFATIVVFFNTALQTAARFTDRFGFSKLSLAARLSHVLYHGEGFVYARELQR